MNKQKYILATNTDGKQVKFKITNNKLHCASSNLVSIDSPLPETLQTLWCNQNQLTKLPLLPTSLQYLHCHYNQLTQLPTLPKSLRTLFCDRNQLTQLPPLPESLEYLYCDYIPNINHTKNTKIHIML